MENIFFCIKCCHVGCLSYWVNNNMKPPIKDIQILSLPMCNNSVMLEMVTFTDKSMNCWESFPCEHTDYTLEGTFWAWQENPKLTLTQG